jgi:hypothetical protein
MLRTNFSSCSTRRRHLLLLPNTDRLQQLENYVSNFVYLVLSLCLRVKYFSNKSFEQLCKFSQLILPTNTTSGINKGNAKRGISPHLKIRPCDLDLWPWKSIGFQILLRSKFCQFYSLKISPIWTKIHANFYYKSSDHKAEDLWIFLFPN